MDTPLIMLHFILTTTTAGALIQIQIRVWQLLFSWGDLVAATSLHSTLMRQTTVSCVLDEKLWQIAIEIERVVAVARRKGGRELKLTQAQVSIYVTGIVYSQDLL